MSKTSVAGRFVDAVHQAGPDPLRLREQETRGPLLWPETPPSQAKARARTTEIRRRVVEAARGRWPHPQASQATLGG